MAQSREAADRAIGELCDAVERDDALALKRSMITLAGNFLDDVRRLADAAERLASALEELT